MHPSLDGLWRKYRAANPAAPPEVPEHFYFADNEHDADLCARLVAEGRKRATAPSVAELELAGTPFPQPGDHAIVTDWSGAAKAVIRTISVEIRRLGDVDAQFARDEGEGDLTLTWWREAHDAYYRNVLAGSGMVVDDDLEIVLERFETVMVA